MKNSRLFDVSGIRLTAALLVRVLAGISLFSTSFAILAQSNATSTPTTPVLIVGQQPWFDIQAYGAVCDGTTDDTVAINATINKASSLGGGTVLIPWTGSPCVADGILLKSNVALRGNHRRLTSLLHKASGTQALISLASPNEVRWGIYN